MTFYESYVGPFERILELIIDDFIPVLSESIIGNQPNILFLERSGLLINCFEANKKLSIVEGSLSDAPLLNILTR